MYYEVHIYISILKFISLFVQLRSTCTLKILIGKIILLKYILLQINLIMGLLATSPTMRHEKWTSKGIPTTKGTRMATLNKCHFPFPTAWLYDPSPSGGPSHKGSKPTTTLLPIQLLLKRVVYFKLSWLLRDFICFWETSKLLSQKYIWIFQSGA